MRKCDQLRMNLFRIFNKVLLVAAVLLAGCEERSVPAGLRAPVLPSATAQVQPGLDVWRPHRRSRAVLRVVEFMTAAPADRGAYYPSEYTASGPATRELRQLGGGATVRRI